MGLVDQINHGAPPAEAGRKLRRMRERLQLTFRDVEQASQRIAARRHNAQFRIGLSRLADIESKATVPSLFRLYSLAAIYRLDFRTLLAWYGIDLDILLLDAAAVVLNRTSTIEIQPPESISVPILQIMADGDEPTRSFYLGRHVRSWGKLPVSLLPGLELGLRRYAFVGLDDWFMYPMLRPGSFVQIDESRSGVEGTGWTSEWDRPIYLIESRTGYRFGWCSLRGSELVLQPHPSSPCAPEVFRHPVDAEIVGQVVAVAMRLDLEKRHRTRSSTDRE
jgi:transcriptional regulator with XRE-family HTH domain